MKREIYTIGYEQSSITDFIDTLKFWQIDLLLDIRELPISRRKGFSKNILASRITEAGLDYIHLKSLGDPKAGRDAAKSGDYDTFYDIFSGHLQTPEAQKGISDLLAYLPEKRVCLMCYERNHRTCHRHLLIEHIKSILPLDAKHLGVFSLSYLEENFNENQKISGSHSHQSHASSER